MKHSEEKTERKQSLIQDVHLVFLKKKTEKKDSEALFFLIYESAGYLHKVYLLLNEWEKVQAVRVILL